MTNMPTKSSNSEKPGVLPSTTQGFHLNKHPASVKQFTLRPHQQGAFDSLCGLYSIINATRLIASPSEGIGKDFCEDFFYALLRYASRRFGLKPLSHHGTPQWLMGVLLRWSCAYVAKRSSLKPVVTQPLVGKGRFPFDTVMNATRGLLSYQGCALIAELGGVHSHWTVIRSVSYAQVHLFDSDGLKVLNLSDMRMDYEKTRLRSRHVLVTRSTFMLARERADSSAD